MRARYYNPDTGRFISEDTHWNPLNMIYGDKTFDEGEIKYPDVTASLQAGNLYAYCMGNPVKYNDINGNRSKEDANQIIKDNARSIKNAAIKFGVNPTILAATIYAEQRLNVDWKDDVTDGIGGFYGIDTSIGVAQIRVSTAKFLEEQGYMPKINARNGGWDIPGIGFVQGTETMARAKALEDPEINIMYAANYLKYFQDTWESTYPEISGRTAILATLFNIGHEKTSPNSNPKPNDFGTFAKDNYYYVKALIDY